MKKYLFLAASALALASCSSDDFIGNNGGGQESATNAVINFNGGAGNITRTTSNKGEAQVMLDYQFKMYGVKKVTNGDNSTYQDVFKDYSLWYDNNKTTTNTNGWEYVGNTGNHGTGNANVTSNQTIKYWDYSSEDYRFVAGSPIANFTFNKATTDGDGSIATATVKGLAGHIKANAAGTAITTNPVYIAEPIVVGKTDYNKTVKFNFVRQQSKVRVGIYETIPGYKIKEIHFYKDGSTTAETGTNIILTSSTADYFVGGKATGTITYDWTTPSYAFAYNGDDLVKQKDWYAGALTGVQAVTSTETDADKFYGKDNDRENNGYFTVIPTPSSTNAAAILIKCDYILESEDNSGETIKVTGATAAIPAAFCKWEPNVMYTYIFKISQNTNGHTGDPDKPGLFPITFDAAVTDFTAKKQGTITTFTTPTITTYQEGSVTDNGVQYITGKPIYATVADEKDGTVKELSTEGTGVGKVQVYKLSQAYTEADLQVADIKNTQLTTGNEQSTTVPSTATTISTGKLDANKHLSFTPTETGTYAIQYKAAADTDTYTYKVVTVVAASTTD